MTEKEIREAICSGFDYIKYDYAMICQENGEPIRIHEGDLIDTLFSHEYLGTWEEFKKIEKDVDRLVKEMYCPDRKGWIYFA